jgi:hypothetical protein
MSILVSVGCGATNQGYASLHQDYDGVSSDSLDRINKGLPFDP